MIFSCCGFASASAVETPRDVSCETTNEDIVPYGSLSGYGGRWNDQGSFGAYFVVNVKGIAWPTAQTTFTIEEFPKGTVVRMTLGKDGNALYTDVLTMGSKESVTNVKFSPGALGEYNVSYDLRDWPGKQSGAQPPAGRVLCWIY